MALLPSNIGDLIASEALAAEFLMLLAERDASILTHPALMHATGSDFRSNVVKVPHVGLMGYDLLSATTPGSEVSDTALTDGHTDVTIASRAKAYSADDLAKYLVGDKFNPQLLAQDAAISVAQTLIDLIANIGDDFTGVIGNSGIDATWNDVIDAKTTLGINNAEGLICAMLHTRQWGDLEVDALSIGGVAASGSMGGVIMQGLGGYKGRYMGVDFFTSNRVPTADAGANRAGSFFTRGAIAWADVEMPDEGDPNIVNLGRARFERVRQGKSLLTSYVTSFHAGVAKALDGAGVTFKTDA